MHPGPPAGRGRWGRGRRREKKGGGRRQRQERGGVADSGAMGGSKGSRSQALPTAPWSCTHAAAEVVVEEGTRAGGGGGANASEARERCVPGLCRSAGVGRQDGAAARAPRAWIPEPSLGGNGAAGVPPSSPTLLFRRWVGKVESLISQPMTSGKNELQDHLIFISEKALHKSILMGFGLMEIYSQE
ncbi:alpha7-takusan isoform X4 [Mus musculus]|uniref:alpha7-takusan isoform X4 n=1 Tax=Mus musculus TaxID=10090 RepID=UPI0003D785EB|nr:alpha7-takusan isoform X4 [Mus musculus]|eukprot:XP_017171192.1 PREDICTED: alpha7-takusan isoform X3 [Mus musculus]